VSPRNAGLDLVRAIAVLMVMVSHWANNMGYWYGVTAPRQVFSLGAIGVDLFFALSGFLIGRILLTMIDRGPTWGSLGVFLIRRWLRTLPLYWIWLAVIAVLWPPAAGYREVWMTALLLQNFAWPMPADYFFSVSWSLTVEEWFYIGFGVTLLSTAMIFGRRHALWPALLLFLGVPLALRIFVPAYASWSNGLWQTVVYRLDGIAYGILLAQLWRRNGWLFRHPTFSLALGLCLIFGDWAGVLLPQRLWPTLTDIIKIVGAVLCLPAAMRLRTIPSWQGWIIARLSAQSYALYLMHETILVDLAQGLYFRRVIDRPLAVIIAVVLPFVLSWLSFSYFEKPLLARRPPQG